LGDRPSQSLDKLFGSHTLSHSFHDSKPEEHSAVEQKRKPSQAAATGKSKETGGETKEHKLGKQGAGHKFKRAQTF